MKLITYKAEKGNFGDDLNNWLWPQFFGSFNESSETAFLGIGSILFNNFPALREYDNSKKIVFGTGIRPTNQIFKLDENWDIKFVRGPLSSACLDKIEYISDAAYAIGLTHSYKKLLSSEKKYEVSVMPYFKSVEYVDWERICSKLGYNYISPLSETNIEKTLTQISETKYLITEAMHGAIVADIFRVPWHRFIFSTPYTEGSTVSEFKWLDWQSSINFVNTLNTTIPMYSRSKIDSILNRIYDKKLNINYFSSDNATANLLNQLSKIKDFSLSKDEKINEVFDRINLKINELKAENQL
jgi:succinoglycan biosynthesis protein ExoV